MTIRNIWFVFLLSLTGMQCATTAQTSFAENTLSASALKPFGRTSRDSAGHLELISSASHIGFRFEGDELQLRVSVPSWLSHNYLQYELDGVYQNRLRVSSKEGETLSIFPPAGKGRHTVWLYKATEASTGPVIIHSVSGTGVQPLERPAVPLIEFIGNSITCGAAADASEVPCGTGVYHDQHNAYLAYGPRVARAIGANFLLSSVSGIGVYRNWNSDGPTMPQVYEKTYFRPSSPPWNFSTYTPQVVSIALGTNDFSRGDGKTARLPFDSATFVAAYVDFVQQVTGKYPRAQIALLSSPMVGGEAGILLQNCLTAVKKAVDATLPDTRPYRPVALFFFEPMKASGCTGHPSVEDHALMAEQLKPFFQQLLQPLR